MRVITAPVAMPDPVLPAVSLAVERRILAKRRWRGTARDGAEFGFELLQPLRHGDVFLQTPTLRYVVEQQPESVLEISLAVAPSAAAGIGWAVGNLHLELSAEPTRLLALDEPGARQLFERLQVPYRATTAIFRPGRFSRNGAAAQELGPSHQH